MTCTRNFGFGYIFVSEIGFGNILQTLELEEQNQEKG